MSKRAQINATSAILQNIYTSPSLEYLQRNAPQSNFLLGEMRITELEISTAITNERAFVALLSARLQSTLGDMVAHLRAPTFPVHDEPAEIA